jgi:ATP-binding cassette subfamily C protein
MSEDNSTPTRGFPAPNHPEGPAYGYSWRWVLDRVLAHRRELVLAHVVALVGVIAAVPIPLVMPLLVDEVLLHKPGQLVRAMNALFPASWHGPVLYILTGLLVTLLLRAVSILLGVWQTREFTLIAKDVVYHMRRALLLRLSRISMAEYETLGSGAVASRFVTDLNSIDEFVGASVSKTLVAALLLVGVSVVLLWMHWQLALVILCMNPVVIYFTVVVGKKVKTLKKRENSAFEMFQQALVETLDGIQQIRAANRERHYLLQVIDAARGIRAQSAAYSWKSDAASRFSFGIFQLGFDSFRAVAMLMVVFSDLTVGQMMAVFGYLWVMLAPVQEILNVQYAWYGAGAALGRVNGLLALQQEPLYPHEIDPFAGKTTVGVRVEKVSFAYRAGEPILKQVSFAVAPGEKVALVGASGGGKSTLVQVILGLYPPTAGQLYFDDVPVSRIGLDVVRNNVAVVLQHPAMFNDSIRNNLTLGGEADEAALWRALDVAQLRDVVEVMPQGLDTLVGRRGVRLSGGQQQRLAIARMLLTNPRVIILDEATSALDTETEARLHAALRRHLAGRTLFIVAHRLSAVRQADRVYVFEDGQIAEEGNHAELMQADGLYANLYRSVQH